LVGRKSKYHPSGFATRSAEAHGDPSEFMAK
jgi:hypothetical protein